MVADGETGFLAAANDRRAFVGHVLALLREPALAARFGAAAAERIDRHFRWDGTVRQVDKVYQEALDGYRRGR
jgi:glycosyltransferase involved in cell wall biosynthesis